MVKLKYSLGVLCIILALVSPLIGFAIASLIEDGVVKATVIGVFSLGIPEILLVLGGVLAGKQIIERFKNKLLAYAGRGRYITGGIIFILGNLLHWLVAYSDYLKPISMNYETKLNVTIALDIVCLLGILAMGPEFIDKIKTFFTYSGKSPN